MLIYCVRYFQMDDSREKLKEVNIQMMIELIFTKLCEI